MFLNGKHNTLDTTVLDMLSNFISHKLIKVDDKDLPWFNNKIKALIPEKNKCNHALSLEVWNIFRKPAVYFIKNVKHLKLPVNQTMFRKTQKHTDLCWKFFK